MKQQLRGKELFLVGVTLFSMFFGAGNLIFPPFVGYQAGSVSLPAFLGMALTAVCFPVLGVVAVAKVGGTDRLCSKIHPSFAIVFTILVYLCIGPMLAIPRTASTSYSMFAFLTARFDGMTLVGIPMDWVLRAAFSLVFFIGAYHLAKRPARFKDTGSAADDCRDVCCRPVLPEGRACSPAGGICKRRLYEGVCRRL